MLKFLYYLMQFTWGLPQNLMGFILTRKYRDTGQRFFLSRTYLHGENWGGISLGIFTVVNAGRGDKWIAAARVHEYGHSIQSLILGPLYLLVIGLPSLLWCRYYTRHGLTSDYSRFYTERWADFLGEKFSGAPSF